MREGDTPERIGYVGPVTSSESSDVALVALAAAVATWWTGTAIVLAAVRVAAPRRPAVLAVATGLALLALLGLALFGDRTDLFGVLGSFVCAVVVWGYDELLFLTGRVVGPPVDECREDCAGLRHAGHALKAIAHHEAALVISAGLVAAVSAGRPNQTGMWAFLILLVLRFSAQLNLFLGVRNLAEAWMPTELLPLRRFLRKRAMNPLLPLSIGAAAWTAARLARDALRVATSEHDVASHAVLAGLAALGALEHVLLVLPFDPTRLWPNPDEGARSR
ncbi:MAG: putative photosynthetic complex assembly protein PuhE [Myxococcota bacterium]